MQLLIFEAFVRYIEARRWAAILNLSKSRSHGHSGGSSWHLCFDREADAVVFRGKELAIRDRSPAGDADPCILEMLIAKLRVCRQPTNYRRRTA